MTSNHKLITSLKSLSLSLSLSLSRSARFLANHKRQIILALSIFVFIIALFLRLGYAYQKGGFFVDESLSIAISTRGHIPQIERGEYFGKDLKQNAYFNDNSMRDLAHDLGELWKNNYGDGAAHPNLYYTLLRAWNFDVKSGDFAWLKARGIGLNLIFFALSFYAAFILMAKIFSHTSLIVPLFLALAFCNSASVSNTIFIRPYALQEMLLMIFVLNCFVFYRLDFSNAKEAFTHHKLFFAWFIFTTALLCISHYFSLFFIAFAFLFLAFLSRKNIFPLSLVVLGSFAIAQILYRGYFSEVIGGYRAKESTEKLLLKHFWQNLEQSFKAGVDILQAHFCNAYGLIVLCVACGIALFCMQNKIRFSRPKTPKFALGANLKAFFALIATNTAKSYKKFFIILSSLAIVAYIAAFVLIALAKDNAQSANLKLELVNSNDLGVFFYTGKISYTHNIFNARSSRVSKLILESISWDKAIDSSAITITQAKNRYIDFSTTQDFGAIWGEVAKDFRQNPQIATLTYRVDFSPLLTLILRYYALIILLSFAIVFYRQHTKDALRQDFSTKSTQESKFRKNAIFLLGFFAIALVWFVFVFFVAPYKDLRYVMSIFAFLYFGVVCAFSEIKKPVWQGILGVAFVASLFINYDVKHLYKTPFLYSHKIQNSPC